MSDVPHAAPRFPWLAMGALLGAMVSISIGTSYATRLFHAVGSSGTTAYRVTFAALILLALWRPWRRSLGRGDALTILQYGVVLGAMNLLFYASLRTIPFGVAMAIEFLGPLALAIAASRRGVDFAWVGCATLGLLLLLPIGAGAARLDPAGVGFALAAAVCWALYILVGQRAGRLHGGQATSLGMSVAMLVVLPFGLAEAGPRWFDPSLLALGLAVGVLSSAVPYSLEMVALRRLPRRTFSITLSMEPAVSALAALTVLGQQLTSLQWLAIGCVVAASVGSAATSRRAPSADEANQDALPPTAD